VPVVREQMTRRGWMLFAAMSLIWGVPCLLIKVAVEHLEPVVIVFGRTSIAAVLVLALAKRSGAVSGAARHWKLVLAFAAIEMAGPFLLLAHAEQTLPSGLTGLLVATVPLFAAIIAFAGGDRAVLKPVRTTGLIVGFVGVGVIVAGPGLAAGGTTALVAIGEVLLVAVLYAIAPFIVARKLSRVPSVGTITLSLGAVGLFYLPIALLTQHRMPTLQSTVSLAALAILCTAVAFIVFFALIAHVGPARAPLFTYVNPVVAVILGIVILGEPLGLGLLIGFPLVIVGCWLAATGGTVRVRAPSDELPPIAPG